MMWLLARIKSKCGIFAILLLALLAGCATPRREPKLIPRVFVRSYVNEDVRGKLKTLPVRLNLKDCVGECVITRTSMTGTSTEAPMPFKKPVEREFNEMISNNFCVADAKRLAKIELKVEPLLIDIMREFLGTVHCKVEFSMKLLDPMDGSKRPFFECIHWQYARCEDTDEKVVPACLYEAIQRTTKKVVDNMAEDPELMGRLEDLLIEGTEPSIDSYNLEPVVKGKHYHGTAYVSCNGRDKWSVHDWAMKRIRSRCHQVPEISRSNYSIITTKVYDDVMGHGQWDFTFDVVVWDSETHFIMLPNNSVGNIGRCILQRQKVSFLSDSNEKHKLEAVMKGLIEREMKRKGQIPLEVQLDKLEPDIDDGTIVKAEYKCNF